MTAELLDRPTTAPPPGAWPFSITMAPAVVPPLIELGVRIKEFSDGGRTVNCTDADTPLSVAVSVTGVTTLTCPACIWNCIQAKPPVIVTVGATGAAVGLELVSAIVDPAADAAVAS